MSEPAPGAPSLRRILGIGFAVAAAFGGTIGVGILRLPGDIAARVDSVPWIALVWIAGGLYATLGAMSVAELVTLSPVAGGFYVFARRAFGPAIGLLVGFNDWAVIILSCAYAALAAADFIVVLAPSLAGHPSLVAIGVVTVVSAVHFLGIRVGSSTQNAISALVAVALVGLILACFLAGTPPPAPAAAAAARPVSAAPFAFAAATFAALRLVLVAYDGWYSSIYFAEETVDAARAVPRAMIGAALLTMLLYLLINAGLLHALTLPGLAAAKLPAVEAARVLLPNGAAELVAAISLVVVLSLLNINTLMAPRILYALGRDGYLPRAVMQVTRSGTPAVALAASSIATMAAIASGSFDQIISASSMLFVLNYLSAYVALFALRRQEPRLPRPFRVPGYPWTPGIVLVGSVVFVVLAIREDPHTALIAGAALAGFAVAAWLIAGRGRAG
ncbi:MAG: APC family permease [Proteobacteria bacterium]|nr:APC family permease [Pseudomonadota bacterium]